MLEKDILFAADHPFLVGMEYLFQSETRLYFVMPFVKGGELYKIFQKEKRFKEETVKFYAVQIVLAIGELHSKGIMHRDLKLENILVDHRGYLKIIDYGLAKIISGDELAMSYCGTQEYLSPEMIEGKGHDKSVDWWALGVLMYELLTSMTPFFNRNRQLLQSRIKHAKVVFPNSQQYDIHYSPEFVDIVTQLLHKDRTKRLGAVGGAKEILAHPFFKGVDIAKYEAYAIEPPFVPQTSEDNTEYFNSKNELEDTFLPRENMQLIKQNQNAFAGFSSKNK